MPVEKRDLASLTHLAMRIRQDTRGAGPWDEHGTAKVIAELVGRNLHITVEHVIRNAGDPKAKTPGVLRGSYTPPAPAPDRVQRALRREQQCARCSGPKGNCHCTRERMAVDHDDDQVTQLSRDEALRKIRDAIDTAPKIRGES